jgi:hypothetical protein
VRVKAADRTSRAGSLNRVIVGSSQFSQRFGQKAPRELAARERPAMADLRGL